MLVSQIDGRSKAVAMTAVATQNVYLLGAGFSKAVSPAMPVMPELAAQVLDELGLDEKMLRPFNGDLESWLSFLSSPQPWLTEAENLRNRASYFDVSSAIFTVINQDEQVALSQPAPIWLQRLVWTMSEQSAVVLTLNYDLLLERVAMVVGRARAFSHGRHRARHLSRLPTHCDQ